MVIFYFIFVLLFLWNPVSANNKIKPVSFTEIGINDNFWSPILYRHKYVTLPLCMDLIEYKTGRLNNFINAADGKKGHTGIFYDDSDVYKALEGIAYSLTVAPDSMLEARADKWIEAISSAQCADGYINTYYALTGISERWSDMDRHEMYCAGHLIEAGIAYYKATGKYLLLETGIKMVDHIMSVFGPSKRHWVPGHEEIELALMKLYALTGNEKYAKFSYWLLEERGHGYGFKKNGHWDKSYYQDSVPVKNLRNISGHAVRAMYLLSAMTDMLAYGQTEYEMAIDSLWNDVVFRHMYITGGIGASSSNEGFSIDYYLPNKEAYCETCASIGMIMWNHRMNLLTGNAKYADIIEKVLYNSALAGISLTGNKFFYVNPLESDGNHHRKEWYGTACCPSQLSRFLPSLGEYIYAKSGNTLFINQFIGNSSTINIGGDVVNVIMKTEYPWKGEVDISLSSEKLVSKNVKIRIPGWCRDFKIHRNGQNYLFLRENGYAVVPNVLSGEILTVITDMPVDIVPSDPHVYENKGKVAVKRGPLIYCMEEVDNPDTYDMAYLNNTLDFYCTKNESFLSKGIVITTSISGKVLNFIPYFAWDNREKGKMKIWIDYHD